MADSPLRFSVGKAPESEASWKAKFRDLVERSADDLLCSTTDRAKIRSLIVQAVRDSFSDKTIREQIIIHEVPNGKGGLVKEEHILLSGAFQLALEALELDRFDRWIQESVMAEVMRQLDQTGFTSARPLTQGDAP